MLCYQGMVVLAGNQVWWTWEVEDVFQKVKKGDKMGMKNYARKMHKQIDELVVKVKRSFRVLRTFFIIGYRYLFGHTKWHINEAPFSNENME